MNRPDKPNLLFIFTNEQRQDTLGVYGNRLIKTPNFDAPARQSLVFDRGYVTQPVCTPARVSILTGDYPHSCGMYEYNRVLSASIATIAEMIEDQEYIKAYFGKWHLGYEEIPQRGFEEKGICIEEMYKPYYTKEAYKTEVADYHRFLVEHGHKPDSALEGVSVFARHFAAALPENLSKPSFLAAEVIKFFRKIGDRPFVLYLSFIEPFFSAFDGMYDPDKVPLPSNADHRPDDGVPLRTSYLVKFFEQHGWPDRSGKRVRLDNERAWRELNSRYWGAVSLVYKYIGAVLDSLQELGLSEKTVTVFASGHFGTMGSHGLAVKGGHMYEETLKVPLLLRIPWLSGAVVRIQQPVSLIDLIPTLLDILAQPSHSQLQGKSWLPAIEGKEPCSDDPVVAEWKGENGDRWIGSGKLFGFTPEELDRIQGKEIRTVLSPDEWKLNLHETGEQELFNLSTDPEERDNLFPTRRDKHKVKELYEFLLGWQEKTCNSLPLRL